MADLLPRFNVLGVGVHALTLADATARIVGAACDRHRHVVCCCDAHSIMQARRSSTHRGLLNHAWLTTPDGMPLVRLAHRAGHAAVNRVYGPDLLETVAAASAGTPIRHFFYGAAPGVAAELAARLTRDHPGFRLCGTHAPPHGAIEDLPLQPIVDAEPDILWVGLGTPKQEAFMDHAIRSGVPFGVALGVGAAFDFLTGRVAQAPVAIRRVGLEWLWRLAHEPRRLGRRYLRTVPSFATAVLLQQLGWKTYPLDRD